MKLFKYSQIFIGCVLIAFSIEFLLIPNNLFTFGFDGLSCFLYYLWNIPICLGLLLLNLFIILISSIFLDFKVINKYLIPSIIIPILLLIFSFISPYFNIVLPEKVLVILVSSFIGGYGYGLIYKQGYSAGNIFLLEELIGKLTKFQSKMYSRIFDSILFIVATILFGYQISIYSLVIILITRSLVTKTRFGISNSKMFYIITSKEKEVKNYIMHDLKYSLTVLDVKGGFTKKNNQILLTVIDTKDYYNLKEGIKLIDEKAFIAITDTYDVINRQ